MATSSITKNFVVSGEHQVNMFADAIEASAHDRTPRIKVSASQLKGTEELKSLMVKRKKANGR